jgi:NitT/TauT family transport system permease protein
MNRILPILTVVLGLIVVWYAGAVLMNAQWTYDQAARAGTEVTFQGLLKDTMAQEKPRLPPPHQVLAELKASIIDVPVNNKRSLIYHGWITLQTTLIGFLLGLIIGVTLAIAIVKSRTVELSVMPWAVISQTIPIVALAPMIVVVFGKAEWVKALADLMGVAPHVLSKAVIAAYLSFFPVLVSMVKGLRSPDPMQLDQLRTWNANARQEFFKLRLPASLPYLIAAFKVSLAAALVGTIVGELPTGAINGLGARMLVGNQFGQPIIMWAALVAATTLAAALIMIVGFAEKGLLRLMGARP